MVSYEEAFRALESGDYPGAADLLEQRTGGAPHASDIVNNAHTLALYRAGRLSRLGELALEIGESLVEDDPASALDYFQRAMIAAPEPARVLRIAAVFERWAQQYPGPERAGGRIRRVAHVVDSLRPGDPRARYVAHVAAGLGTAGIESFVFTTESRAGWFDSPSDAPYSRPVDIDADVRLPPVAGDFIERAERIATAIEDADCDILFFHAGLEDQIASRIASQPPAPRQVRIARDDRPAADLFHGSVFFFRQDMDAVGASDRPSTVIPPVSGIQVRAGGDARRAEAGFGGTGTVSASQGGLERAEDRSWIDALADILTRSPDHVHLFVGTANPRKLRGALHDRELLSRVRFVGPDSAGDLMGRIDLYLAPFPDPDWQGVLDAMGAGTPPVVLGGTPGGRAAELVELDELVASSSAAYVETALGLLGDADYRDAVSQAVAERFRRQFHPRDLASRYLDFVNML